MGSYTSPTGGQKPAASERPARSAISATEKLNELRVAPAADLDDFDRSLFRFKLATDHQGCDVRERAMQESGFSIITRSDCSLFDGAWTDPYSGRFVMGPDYAAIDQIVSLGEAWRSGANEWTPAKRRAFVNDRANLIVSHPEILASKAGRDVTGWLPPDTTTHAAYAARYAVIKAHYGLTVDAQEHARLTALIRAK